MKEKSKKDKKLEELIESCIQKKTKAQHLFFKLFYSSLFSICLRYSNSYEEAEEILNEGFLKIFANLEKYQAGGSFEGWLKRIMVNTAIDYYRKHKLNFKITNYEDVTDAILPFEENSALGKMSGDEILVLIQELPPVSRQVFNLYIFEEYSHAEIAKMLNIKEGTSHWHLSFARSKLKEKIKEKR